MSELTNRLRYMALALCLSLVAFLMAACGGNESATQVLLRLSKPQRRQPGPLLPFPSHP